MQRKGQRPRKAPSRLARGARHGNLPSRPEPSYRPPVPPGAPRIRILFLAANPVTMDALKLTQEVRQIEEQLRASKYRDALEFISRWAVRPDDLQRALLEVEPHIVHFSGHGDENEGIYLESPEGISAMVDQASLVELLGILKDNIRLVVLNACRTRSLAEAIATHIDCAIGMRTDVGDEAAVEFSAAFYRAIGAGRSVKVAFDLGCSVLKLKKIHEDRTPELYRRSGVDPGQVTLVRSLGPGADERFTPPGRISASIPPATPSDSGPIRLPAPSDSGPIQSRAPAPSDPAQAIEPRRSSNPSDPTRGVYRAPWRRFSLVGRRSVALTVIACAAVAALFRIRARRPPAIESFPPAASGVVLQCPPFAPQQADDPGIRESASLSSPRQSRPSTPQPKPSTTNPCNYDWEGRCMPKSPPKPNTTSPCNYDWEGRCRHE